MIKPCIFFIPFIMVLNSLLILHRNHFVDLFYKRSKTALEVHESACLLLIDQEPCKYTAWTRDSRFQGMRTFLSSMELRLWRCECTVTSGYHWHLNFVLCNLCRFNPHYYFIQGVRSLSFYRAEWEKLKIISCTNDKVMKVRIKPVSIIPQYTYAIRPL